MDFEALIKKHVGEDGTVDTGKLASALASAVGREFVEKKRYDDKLREIDALKEEKQTAEDNAAASAAWKQKHDDLDQQFKNYKAEVAGRETLAAKKAAYRKLLDEKKIDSADADLIMAAISFDDIKLDKDGNLEGRDDLVKGIEAKYARYIPEIESKGKPPANPPKGEDGGGMSDIRAMAAKWHAERYGKTESKE